MRQGLRFYRGISQERMTSDHHAQIVFLVKSNFWTFCVKTQRNFERRKLILRVTVSLVTKNFPQFQYLTNTSCVSALINNLSNIFLAIGVDSP